jgi:hypothetical protein
LLDGGGDDDDVDYDNSDDSTAVQPTMYYLARFSVV